MSAETQTRIDDPHPSPPEPVLAEVVPPTPPPYRFGLRAMMGLTAVCCLQFAVMNWFGVIPGMLLATAACFVAFSGVFVAAMLLARGSAVWLDRLDQIGIRLVVAMAVLMIGTVLAGGGMLAFHQLARLAVKRQIEQDLGLATERVPVVSGDSVVYGLEITKITTGGVADKSGLRIDEVIMPPGTSDEFFAELHRQRGKEVSFQVASGAQNQPLEKCTQWDVPVVIPAR